MIYLVFRSDRDDGTIVPFVSADRSEVDKFLATRDPIYRKDYEVFFVPVGESTDEYHFDHWFTEWQLK